MSRFAAIVVFLLLLAYGGSVRAAEKPISPQYEKMLYDLGAFPVSRLTQRFFTNGNPGQVYSKGTREDVDGWLPPGLAARYLTDAEKLKYGIPRPALRYEQYLAMLNPDAYKMTHDAGLLLIMRFALQSMAENQVQVQKADILRVYEARIGLEAPATRLLFGQLSGEDAMRLLKSDADLKLFSILPAPRSSDTAYIAFLIAQTRAEKWPLHCRQDAFRLLFALDGKSYREPYRRFLVTNAKTAEDWWERSRMYDGLVQLHDAESMAAVCEALAHDPITDCRELILYSLREHGDAVTAMDAILTIANGKDTKHHAVSPGRMYRQWSYSLDEYLKWAKTQKGLDPDTKRKIDEASKKLSAGEVEKDD